MFRMSREELIARLDAVTKMSYDKIPTEKPIKPKLLLYVPSGVVSCSSAKIPTQNEYQAAVVADNAINLLELALSSSIPDEVRTQQSCESFLYCKDAKIITFDGHEFPASALCIPLASIFGFSVHSET